MKKTWIIGLLVLVVLISGCTYGPKPETQPAQVPQTTNTIEIKGFAFNPATITIAKGTAVTWTNKDSAPHTVTGDVFSSETLNQGQTYSFTFNEAGSFEYQCHIHPSMRGKVIVT